MHCQTLPGHNANIREMDVSNRNGYTYSTVEVEYLSTAKYEKYQALLRSYHQERALFPRLMEQLPAADHSIKRAIGTISGWDFSVATLELTEDANAVFKIRLEAPRTLYIGLNLKEEDKNYDMYFSFYEGDRCERNGVGSFSDVITDLATLKIL